MSFSALCDTLRVKRDSVRFPILKSSNLTVARFFLPLLWGIVLSISSPFSVEAKSEADKEKELGDFLYFHGDRDEAIERFEHALELEPDMVDAHLSLVNLYLMKKDRSAAIEHAKALVKLKPEDKNMHMLLGNLYRGEKRYDLAVKEFEEAIVLGAPEEAVMNILGYINLDLKQSEKALICFARAAGGKDRKAATDARLGAAVTKFKLNRGEDALADLDILIKDGGGTGSAYLTRGHLRANLNRLDGALLDYKAALKKEPENAKIHEALGNIYYRQGRKEEAEKAFLKSVELDKNNAPAHYSLGTLDLERRRFEEAAAHLERGASVDENVETRRKMKDLADKLRSPSGAKAASQADSIGLTSNPNFFKLNYCDLLVAPATIWQESKDRVKLDKPNMVPGRSP